MSEELTPETRVSVYSQQTGLTFKVPWRRVDTARKRKQNQLELIDEPTPPTPEETKQKVADLKKEMGVKESKPEPVKEVKPETVAEETTDSEVVEETKSETPDYESMELADLKELATERGLKFAKNAGKAKMIEVLTK